MEASPSPVYGARLLSGFGASTPSRVQIPPPPRYEGVPVYARGPLARRSWGGVMGDETVRSSLGVPRRAAAVAVLAVVVVGAGRLASRGASEPSVLPSPAGTPSPVSPAAA